MSGVTKLMTAGGGGVALTPASSIASDVTVNVPSVNCTLYGNAGTTITSGTAVASTSGTSIDFTGIPSWVKRITVIFNGVSTNGTSQIQTQVGAGSIISSGYTSSASYITTGVGSANSTTGFLVTAGIGASSTFSGAIILVLLSNNTWVSFGSNSLPTSTGTQVSGGNSPALSGPLDRVRVTTVNGTDTFDAGSINILYE